MKRIFLTASHLSPGVVDAGLASIATFAAGLAGVNLLGDVDRGVYGIFFTSFILGGVVISQLIYVPAQVVAVGQIPERRLDGLRRSIMLALVPSIVGSLAAGLAALMTSDLTTNAVVLALTVTTAATIVVSAMQDHVRRLLHVAEKSWRAVAVSGTQLVAIALAIPILMATDLNRAWIPYGSLFLANVASLAVGVILAGAHRKPSGPATMDFRGLAMSGKWLIVRSAVPSGAAFLAANLLTRLAGPEAYGYAEAARQVAQPVTVLALGLSAVLGPRAVRASMDSDARSARGTRREYGIAIGLVAAAYAALTGVGWSLNPMSHLVPSAYEVGWLVSLTILANAIAAGVMLLTSEMLGAGKARILASLAFVSSPALLIVAATAGTLGALARPVGYIFEGTIVLYGANRWLKRHYAGAIHSEAPTTVEPQ